MIEFDMREHILSMGSSLFNRGYSCSNTGNISVLLPDRTVLITPFNASLGKLDPTKLSRINMQGEVISGDVPSNHYPLHLAVYENRPRTGAVIHVHSPYLTALSCLKGLDPDECLPPLTSCYVTRIGKLPLIPYYELEDKRLIDAISARAAGHSALLLANHGAIVSAANLQEAVFNTEALENTAKIYMHIRHDSYNVLSHRDVTELGNVVVLGG